MATVELNREPVGREPSGTAALFACGLALAFVALTRLPVARPSAYDFDEVGYLETIRQAWLPIQHTLFLAAARGLGDLLGDPYRGFVLLDVLVSGLALASAWWWLRAVAGPWTAAALALVLGCGPVFWAYGGMAGNYTAIPLVGSFLLGILWREPRRWHPYAAAAMLAAGTGYRQDIGTFWLPIFVLILWRHRWRPALAAGLLFTALNLAWLVPMIVEAGGWSSYRAANAEFAYKAGYLNSVWNLGLIDAPMRYAVKAAMSTAWTFGPGLLLIPLGLWRLGRSEGGGRRLAWLALSVAPAFASHLLIHFGVPGYGLHYAPALLALLAIGLGAGRLRDLAVAARGLGLAAVLAALFLGYPTNYDRPGLRGQFDLAFARHTRRGLATPPPVRDPVYWRTMNSQELPGESGRRTDTPRRSLAELLDGE